MSGIQSRVPTYAAFPNLAWQALSCSDNSGGGKRSAYSPTGVQLTERHAVAGLEEEMERFSECGREARNGVEPACVCSLAGREAAREDESLSDPDGEDGEPCLLGAEEPGGADEPVGFRFLGGAPRRHRLETTFPMRCFINLGRREDRRFETEYQFALQGLAVERFAAVDGRWARNTRGHGSPNQYGCRLSHTLAIRQAWLRKAPTVLIFEDDVILHDDFRRLGEALQPPEDWGVLFFGCTHVQAPEVVAPGWVRIKHVWGLHAYAVRRAWYKRVLKALRAEGVAGEEQGADVVLSRLSGEIPMYAVYPNIAWQDEGYSDLRGNRRRPFRLDGHQNRLLHVLRPVNSAMRKAIEKEYGRQTEGFDFLTPEEVHGTGKRSARWKMEDVFPVRRYLNLDHRADRRVGAERQFACQALDVERFAALRGAENGAANGLTPGQAGCALSHCEILESAVLADAEAVLIFEDDVVLHPRMREWCEASSLPGDWGILYFGCQHVSAPERVAAPGLVRVGGAYSTHAYVVRKPHIGEVASAIRSGLLAGKPCDVALAGLHRRIPTYAFYPNLAWQEAGYSEVKQAQACGYGPGGVQRWHRATLYRVDEQMRSHISSCGAPGTGTGRGCSGGVLRFKSFWQKFDYGQATGGMGAGIEMLFGLLQGFPLVVGSVFGHDPSPYDVLFSGECLTDLRHDGEYFVFREIRHRQWGKARWFAGIPWIAHPRALHVPLFYLPWAERVAARPVAHGSGNEKKFGVSIVASNLSRGGLAARRVALAHELSHFVPVHGNRALQATAPPGSGVVYHDVPDKRAFVSSFTHHLCFENHPFPGYLTEKVFDALWAGAAPLYTGDPMVMEWFEEDSIFLCDGKTAEEIAETIRKRPAVPKMVNARRELACLVSLEEMRERVAAFQRAILSEAGQK